MTLWFISDTHFHHKNIIDFAGRPFNDVEEMNECMVERWNTVVKPSDHIYHLGDVTMERDNRGNGLGIMRRLNGRKRLIMGNHDHYAPKWYMEHFEKIKASTVFDGLLFTHIPVHPEGLQYRLKYNVHGHIHEKNYPLPYINICVEQTKYRPISLEEIKQKVV